MKVTSASVNYRVCLTELGDYQDFSSLETGNIVYMHARASRTFGFIFHARYNEANRSQQIASVEKRDNQARLVIKTAATPIFLAFMRHLKTRIFTIMRCLHKMTFIMHSITQKVSCFIPNQLTQRWWRLQPR